ncbi:MAG TPA: DUF748 domain-containing protein [Thermoanaerobaculia bacterium]|nr:DUF748 domain-containing protein [Thermoanaerobaculia bacterium]
MKPLERWNRPLARKALGILAGLLVLWAVAGFLVLPGILRGVVERKLAERLHRPVTLRRLSLNPFALSATLDGLDVKEKGNAGPFFSFERLYLNVEAVSLFKGGPVVRAIALTKPSIALVRKEDGSYNIQDLLDEASKPRSPEEKPLRFSLNNILVDGGSVDFEDGPNRTKHTVREMRIGIPFLSNIPSKVEITTQPVFEAKVNGAPFALHGQTKPFSGTHETRMDLEIADMDLPHYLAYAAAATRSRLTSGRLDAKVSITFAQPPQRTPALLLSGTAALRKVAVEIDGKPIMSCERFEAALASFNVFEGKARLSSLRAVGPELWVTREKAGDYVIAAALVAPARRGAGKAEVEAPKEPEAKRRRFLVEIADMGIERGRIHFESLNLSRPFRAVLGDVAVSMKGFSTAPGKAASLEAFAKSDAGETFKNTGTVSMDPLVLEGIFSAGGLPLRRYESFFGDAITFGIEDGVLDLKTNYRFATGSNANTTLAGLSAELKSPRLTRRGAKEAFFRAPSVTLAGTSLDLVKHDVVVGDLASAGGFLAVARDKAGNADIAKLVAERAPAAAGQPPAEPWNVALGRLALDGYTMRIEDQATQRPARYTLTKVDLHLENLSTARGSKGSLEARFGVDGKGVAGVKGPVGFDPMFADLKAEVKGIPLVPIQAYLVQNLQLSLARGALSASGALKFGEGANAKASFTYAGNALVAGVLAVDSSTNLDFVRWETFSAQGMKAGYNPMFLEISRLALSGLACDMTIEADGTSSLQRITGAPPTDGGDEESEQAPAAGVAPDPAGTPAPPPPATTDTVPIRIDTLTLQGGRVGFADRSVAPNYSGTLADLAGRMTGLSSKEGTVAQLEARGSLANHSPLQISGSVNPLAAAAFADVKASFRNIDLPPFTPYSGKYAGYTITRGALTMEVSYKLQNRKLAAQNHFLVDQFEFGEKVESKTATKLPVRLAVSLLRDKDGLIDLDLPIEGSLDDPKFRIGKVIWKVIGNLIGKAATAPFALLGKLLGGGGQEFSSVDFADGRDTPDEPAKKKLDALAKALENRPALKLEATGRVSGDKDREGIQRLRLERKVKAQKLADLAKKGEAPASVDDVVVDEKEYEAWLTKAYKMEKFDKPRNALGFAKEIPAEEMESLMLANLAVTDDDLRQLALYRANAVKDYLTGPGNIDSARVFVLEPGAKPASPPEKAPSARVDFSLR